MKLLLISSSPHREKSNTLGLAKEVLRGCANECGNPEIIHLSDLNVSFCRHCEECHKNIMHCLIKDDVHMILNKVLEADGIILASPNYINQVTASMKALFDRASHFIHCKRLLGKYVAGVVSSGSGQDKDVLDYIRYYAHTCGAQYSGGVSSRVPISDEKNKEMLDRLISHVSIETEKTKGNKLKGKTFVFTGTLLKMSREEAKEKVQEFEMIIMFQPLITILLAAIFIEQNVNVHIFIASIIASTSLIIAHIKKMHFHLSEYSWGLVIASFFISVEIIFQKILL